MSYVPTLIGISGKKRAGKDETCRIAIRLFAYLGLSVKRLAFADALKREVWEDFFQPWGIYKSYEESISEENRDRNRRLWQFWGTDFRRCTTPEQEGQLVGQLFEILETDFGMANFSDDDAFALVCFIHDELPKSFDAYWIEKIRGQAEELIAQHHIPIITDVRFPNEKRLVEDMGGESWKVVRPGLKEDHASSHASETALDNEHEWDWIILNDRTIPDIEEQVRNYLEEMLDE